MMISIDPTPHRTIPKGPIAHAGFLAQLAEIASGHSGDVYVVRVNVLTRLALGGRARKRQGHFESDHTRAVRSLIDRDGFDLFHRSASASLASLVESGVLARTERRELDWLAMLAADDAVALIRRGTLTHQQLIVQNLAIAYSYPHPDAITDPIERTRYANACDVVAVWSWHSGRSGVDR